MRISGTGISSRQHGFTLVELAVVLVIVTLVATLVLPRLTGFGDAGLRQGAQGLALVIKSLYNEAALRGETHLLVIELDRSRYAVHRMEEKGEVFEEVAVGEPRQLPRGVRFRDVTIRGRGTARSGEVKLHAYPVGWMDETTIHLESDNGRVRTVHIPPLAGMAKVYENDRTF